MPVEPVIYVVDDDAGTRSVVTDLLATIGLEATQCARASELLNALDPDRPALLVLDVRLPDASGLELLEELRRRETVCAAIVISGYGDVPMAVQALKSGAVDFLEKPLRSQDLLEKVQRVRAELVENWGLVSNKRAIAIRLASLTLREHDVLELVVAGRSNKEVADALDLSLKTVEFHRANVMRKMDAESVVDLVRQVLRLRGADVDET